MKSKILVTGLVVVFVAVVLLIVDVFYGVSRMRNGHFSQSMNNQLREKLRSEDEERQMRALVFMTDWSPSVKLRSDIESLIDSESNEIRFVAVELIGRFADQEALDFLLLHSDDPDPEVAEEIQRQIEAIHIWMQR